MQLATRYRRKDVFSTLFIFRILGNGFKNQFYFNGSPFDRDTCWFNKGEALLVIVLCLHYYLQDALTVFTCTSTIESNLQCNLCVLRLTTYITKSLQLSLTICTSIIHRENRNDEQLDVLITTYAMFLRTKSVLGNT